MISDMRPCERDDCSASFHAADIIYGALCLKSLGIAFSWSPMMDTGIVSLIYQVWFFSGATDGMDTRVVDMRDYPRDAKSKITVAGFE